MSKKYRDRIGAHIGVESRFAAGMLILPPYLLIEGLLYKSVLAALFAVLAVLAGKRLRWGYFLIIIVSVTFFHLLAPWGRVMMEVGPLVVTSGALVNGLTRAVTLVGMVFLSVAAVRPELKFPGRLGGLLGRTFYYFDSILEGKKHLSRKNFFVSLDELLMERFNPEKEKLGLRETESTELALPHSRRGWLLAGVVVLIPWILWIRTLLVDG